MKTLILIILLVIPAALTGQGKIEGKVMISGGGGVSDSIALPGANIIWAGTATGTSTNPAGYFSLRKIKGKDKLVASFVGYTPDTVTVDAGDEYIC